MSLSNVEKQAKWRERNKAKRAIADLSRAEVWANVKPLVERLEKTALDMRQLFEPLERRPYIENKRILAKIENKYRPGTNRHARFALYTVGQTISEFRQACAAQGLAVPRVRRDIREGRITIG
jgi:hypothetical protein